MAIISSQTENTKAETPKNLALAITNLKEHLLKYETENLFNIIRNVKDVYQYRYIIKQVESSDKAVAAITDLILAAIQRRQRFRTLDCLKVLKSLVKNLSEGNDLPKETTAKLFEIYKHFILTGRDDIKWCVSSIIKDKKLDDEAIDWLVSNQLHSTHIVNRLLLYPYQHSQIKNWVEQVLFKDDLQNRRSELIAILIEKDLPKIATKENSSTIQWAIFKSRLPYENKIELLKRYSDVDSLQATIEIADRLNSPDILRNLLEKLENVNTS